jgi:hypothetical protein
VLSHFTFFMASVFYVKQFADVPPGRRALLLSNMSDNLYVTRGAKLLQLSVTVVYGDIALTR